MVALDLLGRRGALRILWELRAGPLRFRALQAAADLSPSVLNARLRELRSARLVEATGAGYGLTGHGRSLSTPVRALARWADAWAAAVDR